MNSITNDSDIATKIIGILRSIVTSDYVDAEINKSTNISDELGIYSAQFIDLIVELEDTFNIQVKNSEFPKLITVGDITDLVFSRIPQYKAS